MFDCLYAAVERAYTHDELAFPVEGINFSYQGAAYRRPYIVFNMVSSVDGKATTNHGELTGLGSRVDRDLMTRLRSQVDAVLVGGGTLRVDPFIPTIPPELIEERSQAFPDRPQPLGIVVSNSGNLPLDHRFWDAGRQLRLVFLGATASQANASALAELAEVQRIPEDAATGDLHLAQMLDSLYNQWGVKRLLVEGGPSLNYSLISQGWSDELFLSLSPRLVGGVENFTTITGPGYGMGTGKLPCLKLRSLYRHEDELFLRYQILH